MSISINPNGGTNIPLFSGKQNARILQFLDFFVDISCTGGTYEHSVKRKDLSTYGQQPEYQLLNMCDILITSINPVLAINLSVPQIEYLQVGFLEDFCNNLVGSTPSDKNIQLLEYTDEGGTPNVVYTTSLFSRRYTCDADRYERVAKNFDRYLPNWDKTKTLCIWHYPKVLSGNYIVYFSGLLVQWY